MFIQHSETIIVSELFKKTSKRIAKKKNTEEKWLCFNFKINVLGSKIDVGNQKDHQDDNLCESICHLGSSTTYL